MKTIQDLYFKQIIKNLKQFKLKSDTDKLLYMTNNLKLLNFSIDKSRSQAVILTKKISDFEDKIIFLGKLIIKKDFITFEKEFFKMRLEEEINEVCKSCGAKTINGDLLCEDCKEHFAKVDEECEREESL